MVEETTSNRTNREFNIDIQEGDVPGYTIQRKFGFNAGVGTTVQDIWSHGGTKINATVEGNIDITSSVSTDEPAGIGLRSVRIIGFDKDFNKQREDILTNGFTPVTSVNKYIRIYRMIGLTAGSSGVNQGEIRAFLGGNVEAVIPPGLNQTQMTQFTIPANSVGYLQEFEIRSESDSAIIQLVTQEPGGLALVRKQIAASSSSTVGRFDSSIKLPEKTDVKFTARTPSGAANNQIEAEYAIKIIKYQQL